MGENRGDQILKRLLRAFALWQKCASLEITTPSASLPSSLHVDRRTNFQALGNAVSECSQVLLCALSAPAAPSRSPLVGDYTVGRDADSKNWTASVSAGVEAIQ